MKIGLCTFPCDGDVVTAKRFGFVMERLGNVANEVDEKFKGLLSVRSGVFFIIHSSSLYVVKPC
jgi:hypothetical protein